MNSPANNVERTCFRSVSPAGLPPGLQHSKQRQDPETVCMRWADWRRDSGTKPVRVPGVRRDCTRWISEQHCVPRGCVPSPLLTLSYVVIVRSPATTSLRLGPSTQSVSPRTGEGGVPPESGQEGKHLRTMCLGAEDESRSGLLECKVDAADTVKCVTASACSVLRSRRHFSHRTLGGSSLVTVWRKEVRRSKSTRILHPQQTRVTPLQETQQLKPFYSIGIQESLRHPLA